MILSGAIWTGNLTRMAPLTHITLKLKYIVVLFQRFISSTPFRHKIILLIIVGSASIITVAYSLDV